jgi:F-type H+-transporting ATPase subunit epsilon
MMQPGVLRVVKGSEEVAMAVTGGFIEVRDNRVTILADAAERGEEIDTARAEEARRHAQEQLAAGGPADDVARAEAALKHALMRLKAAEMVRRRRRPAGPSGPPPGQRGSAGG